MVWKILKLEPSLASPPENSFLVHSGVSFSRRGGHASFSFPFPLVSEHCLLTPEIPSAPYSAHVSASPGAGRLRPGGLESRRPGWCAAGRARRGSYTGAGFLASQGPASAGCPCNQPQWGPTWNQVADVGSQHAEGSPTWSTGRLAQLGVWPDQRSGWTPKCAVTRCPLG